MRPGPAVLRGDLLLVVRRARPTAVPGRVDGHGGTAVGHNAVRRSGHCRCFPVLAAVTHQHQGRAIGAGYGDQRTPVTSPTAKSRSTGPFDEVSAVKWRKWAVRRACTMSGSRGPTASFLAVGRPIRDGACPSGSVSCEASFPIGLAAQP